LNTEGSKADTSASQAAERYKKDLALLRTLMATASSSLELDHVLNLALHTVLEALGPGFAGLFLMADRGNQGFTIAAHQGLSVEHTPGRLYVGDCLCSRAMESGMPMFERECPGHSCHTQLMEDQPHSHLSFPLIARQNVVGAACLFCSTDFQIDILDLSLWEDIGRLIGKAIEDANLEHQLQQQRELMQALYDVSTHLSTSLDLEWVLRRVLRLSISATEAQDGSIFLLPTAGNSTPRILRRDLPAAEADLVIEQVIGRGLAGWVVRNKMAGIVADTSQDPRWLSFADEPNPPGSALAVPLMADDRVLGVLTLDHPEAAHFESRHLVLMVAIAHQASAAVEKARLYKEISHMAEVLEQRVEERTRELRETQAQLVHAEKLAALGELAAGVAHEINNPLHILQAYVEYMGTLVAHDDSLLQLLEPMRNSLESMAHLTAQLRDFSRPALGERKPVDINDTVGKVMRLATKELMHSKIEIRSSLHDDLPAVIGDARQLEQVFLNLILNARDAMPGGGELAIETYADTADVYTLFRDTGIGIAEDDMTQIFEPYFTTKRDRGTGLGLAICQRLVAQHGGKIQVQSRLGEGAQFTVRLPVAVELS